MIKGKGGREMEEYNDVYDENRVRTGRVHLRGTPWKPGEYGLVVCVWVYDGEGSFLLTRRAREKSYAGIWENSGGAARAGEESLQAVVRELWEETGILAEQEQFEKINTGRDDIAYYDFYCLHHPAKLEEIRLLPGETDAVQWADYEKIHRMIRSGEICDVIGKQFLQDEKALRLRNMSKLSRETLEG